MGLYVFLFVYAGMILGGVPGLGLDRTGVALLGAIALLAFGGVGLGEAVAAMDAPTLILLFALMVLSAQLRLGGFYTWVVRRLGEAEVGPAGLLALLMAAAALLSALLANDIVCLAMSPILVAVCRRRGLNPLPQLLGLACAANIGSAATLIGNPQNILIGEALKLSFGGYALLALPPAALGTAAAWAIIARVHRGDMHWTPAQLAVLREPDAPAFNGWQSAKGVAVLAVMVGLFLHGGVPRELAALGAAGVVLLSRRMGSREMLGLVDWQLLVLFMGLFVVNHGLETTGLTQTWPAAMARAGVDLAGPGTLFAVTTLLSNLISNVPAVMLLLPVSATPQAGYVLAVSSTLAGNLLLVGSIANLIVVAQAGMLGVRIGWREHARVGLPVGIVTLVLAWAWTLLAGDWLTLAAG